MDTAKLWESVVAEIELKKKYDRSANTAMWLGNAHLLSIEDGHATIYVNNVFTDSYLQRLYRGDIEEILKRLEPSIKTFSYKVGSKPTAKDRPTKAAAPAKSAPQPNSSQQRMELGSAQPTVNSLNPRYTFNNYVVGSSNDFAHATAQAIAKNPGTKYNPLFVYGGVGLGKTHLMQAIGNEIHRKDPTKKIAYVSIESFTNEFIDAIQKKKNSAFTDKYRNVDVLIIDDMQFLAGKEKTQDEFFHTFNALHEANKQIIISSDKPPKQLTSLEDRLISRFEMGITVDVQPPDLETRSAILQTKSQSQGVMLDLEIIDFLARFAQSNIRELEGALTKVIAHYEMKGGELDIMTVKRLLAGEASQRSRFKPLSPKTVIEKVAHYFDLSTTDICGSKRDKEIVVPRQITMYLMRHELNLSFPKIAAQIGGRDHTTAMHSVSKIEKAIESDEMLRSDLQAVREMLLA